MARVMRRCAGALARNHDGVSYIHKYYMCICKQNQHLRYRNHACYNRG